MNKLLSLTIFFSMLGTSVLAGGIQSPVMETDPVSPLLVEEVNSSPIHKETHMAYFVEMSQSTADYTLNNMGVGDVLDENGAGFGFGYGQTLHNMDKHSFYGWDVAVNFNGDDYQFPGDEFQTASYSRSASLEATGRLGKHMDAKTAVYGLAGASVDMYEVSVAVDNGVQQNSENFEGLAVSAILGAGVERRLENGRSIFAEVRRNEVLSMDLGDNVDFSAGNTSVRLGYKVNF